MPKRVRNMGTAANECTPVNLAVCRRRKRVYTQDDIWHFRSSYGGAELLPSLD